MKGDPVASGLPQERFSTFGLPVGTFDALARGDLDQAAVRLLIRAEYDRRRLLLLQLLKTCRADPSLLGPLGGVTTAEALLFAVEAENEAAVEHVLAYPQTGMWLTHAVRLLRSRGQGGTAPEPEPRWVHLGGVTAFAASAALRAGMAFELTVPTVDGSVLLPTLGRAEVAAGGSTPADRYGVATLRAGASGITVIAGGTGRSSDREPDDSATGAHRVVVPFPLDREHPGWVPLPVIEAVGAGSRVLRVRLDHVDPVPGRVGLPPPVEPDIPRWQRSLAAAWQMLDADHPTEATALAVGLRSIVPLSSEGARVLGGSSADGFGAAAICLPTTVADLAALLVHEFRHSVLNGLLHLVDLCRAESPQAVYYAPWRSDPRPLIGLLHGAYAFTAVTDFWRARWAREAAETGGSDGGKARRAELEFALWRWQTAAALEQLTGHAQLTSLGQRMVDLLGDRLEPWLGLPVSAEAARLARIGASSHRTAWRAHHLDVGTRWADEAAREWRTGGTAPRPATAAVVQDPQACDLDRVFVLARLTRSGSSGPLPHLMDAARNADPNGADEALVRGETVKARDRYVAELATDPDDRHPWGGLGLALADADARAASASSRLLVEHPERVRAVYRKLRKDSGTAPDVIELAGWLASAG